jgi:hypothetical protein
MTCTPTDQHRRLMSTRSKSIQLKQTMAVLFTVLWALTACSRLSPYPVERDLAADRIVSGLKQINAGLEQFKCVGKMTLSGKDRSLQSFRAAMAGKLANQLRIDMFAPVGGSNGTFASDGRHLFLVIHASREYLKKRFGNGSLHRFLKIDVTVADLLTLLVGRIPIDDALLPRMGGGGDGRSFCVDLKDRGGKLRQRVFVDAFLIPVRSEWFDGQQKMTHAISLGEHKTIDGFRLPMRIDLIAASGGRLNMALERYEPNAGVSADLFAPAPLQ